MLTISKPLSASQVRTYDERDLASERQNYWSRDQQGDSEWQGKLAEQWGLDGPVGNEHFERIRPSNALCSCAVFSVALEL
jgi:hypothetical protein